MRRLARAEFERRVRIGYASVGEDGVPRVLADGGAQGTILEPVELVDVEPPRAGDVVDVPGLGPTEVVVAITRADLLASGDLVDVSEAAREAGFAADVAVTRGVLNLVEPTEAEAAVDLQDFAGRLWDVLMMARYAVGRRGGGAEVAFEVLFRTRGRPGVRGGLRQRRLKMVSGPGDRGEHVLTIMLPEED